MTCLFTLVFLYMKFKAVYIISDEILKGTILGIALFVSLALTADSGGCLNPWHGLAQNAYATGLINGVAFGGDYWSSAIWVYILAPFIGAIIATLLLRL